MAEKRIILEKAIERKPDCFYFVDGEGNVCETDRAKGRTKNEDK